MLTDQSFRFRTRRQPLSTFGKSETMTLVPPRCGPDQEGYVAVM